MDISRVAHWILAGIALICLIAVVLLLALNGYRIVDEVNKGGGVKIVPFTGRDFLRATKVYAERSPDAPLLKRQRFLMILFVGLWILLVALYWTIS